MKLTGEILTDALDYIDEDMLAAAADLRMKTPKAPAKFSHKRLLAMAAPLAAACLCLVMFTTFATWFSKSGESNTASTEGSSFKPDSAGGISDSMADSVDSDMESVTDSLTYSFEALILEIHEDSLLVEPGEDTPERRSSDKILVSLEGLSREELTELTAGQRILVIYDGAIAESYPAQIHTVLAIRGL